MRERTILIVLILIGVSSSLLGIPIEIVVGVTALGALVEYFVFYKRK